ncbi:MAG: hypothetical protein Tsb009_25530 [Planctomycetaceae bacterium]
MSDETPQPDSEPKREPTLAPGSDLPDELPPVQPPSAGFIVQLFLIPGLIVLVVVGVWALFGRMASSEQDWQVLVEELKHPNSHRRWRGAMGLAQLLRADQNRKDDGERLTENPEIAKALTNLLRSELESKSQSEVDVKQLAFLARTLRLFDLPDIVLPVLQQAMKAEPHSDERIEIRKNAIGAIAVIAGRAAEQDEKANKEYPGPRLKKIAEFPSLVDDLLVVTNDENPLIRQLGTFTLGLFPTDDARQRLETLLDHSDEKTRMNAAIGLARQKSTKGLPVFKSQFQKAAREDQELPRKTPEEQSASRYFWAGIFAVAFLLTAVWAFGTTRKNSRGIAAVLCVGAITGLSVSIYQLVEHRASDVENLSSLGKPSAENEGLSFQERRQQVRSARFEQLVVLRNCLKAVESLNDELSPEEKAELLTLIKPLAKRHSEQQIRIDAGKAVQTLAAQ